MREQSLTTLVTREEAGFTLIELLVAVGILGILAAIAISQYQEYKAGGFDARAQLTLRTVATAQEAYFIDYTAYKDCDQNDCHTVITGLDPVPPGVVLQITATPSGFTGSAYHIKGSGNTFTW